MQSYYRSTVNQTTMKTTQTKKTPFCNACFKAGKNEGEYTSHFTRSSPGQNGIVVCPTVLSASCNYCGKSGHWANEKHCPAMKKDQANQAKLDRQAKPTINTTNKKEETKKGGFAALAEDDDDDFKPTTVVSLKRKRDDENSWASIASQPAKLVFVEDKPIYFSQNPTADEGQKEAQKIFQERRREMRMKRSWADNDSSDDEEAVDYCLGNSAW